MKDRNFKKGIYRHFKGKKYKVIDVLIYKNEEYILYQKQYDDMSYWIRPYGMFFETIERDGKSFERFALVDEVIGDNIPDEITAFHSETLDTLSLHKINDIWYLK